MTGSNIANIGNDNKLFPLPTPNCLNLLFLLLYIKYGLCITKNDIINI